LRILARYHEGMALLPVASWFPKCLTQAVTALAPGCVPLLVAATGTVAWPVAAGVACVGAVVWLNRWEGRVQNDELNAQLKDYFQYLLQTQAGTRDEILEAIKKHADKLPAALPLDDAATDRLVTLTQAVQKIAATPALGGDERHTSLEAALSPLIQGNEQAQALIAEALLDARDRFDDVKEALGDLSEDLAAAAQSLKDHTTDEHKQTRDLIREEVANLAQAQLTESQTNNDIAQALVNAQDNAASWQGKYEAAIARQVEAGRDKGVDWKDTIETIREEGPSAVLKFLQAQAPDADERAEQAELYAEMFSAAMAAIDYPAAEDAARLWTAHAPDDSTAWNDYGFVQSTRGRYAGALIAYRESEHIKRATLGDDHPNLAISVNNIGTVLQHQGDLNAALAAYRDAERIDRGAFGDADTRVAIRVNNIGSVLHDRGDLDGAIAAYRDAERIDRAAFGNDHPKVANCVNNIGSVLYDLGDIDGALAVFRDAERISRAALGDNHPDVATHINNIGLVLKTRGNLDAALAAYRDAERIDRAAFGDDHPNVARDVYNIGRLLQDRGDLRGALVEYRDAERIDRSAFGDDHPKVARDVNNIGSVLQDQGDLHGALSMYREAERIERASFGDDHPEVAVVINNIGSVLESQGDLEDALAAYSDAKRISRAAFGEDHPKVAAFVNNIGSVLYSQGNRKEAMRCFKQAFDIDLRYLGPRAMNTLTRAHNLHACDIDPIVEARRIAGDQVADELAQALDDSESV